MPLAFLLCIKVINENSSLLLSFAFSNSSQIRSESSVFKKFAFLRTEAACLVPVVLCRIYI